jgi:hypothetical protein
LDFNLFYRDGLRVEEQLLVVAVFRGGLALLALVLLDYPLFFLGGLLLELLA